MDSLINSAYILDRLISIALHYVSISLFLLQLLFSYHFFSNSNISFGRLLGSPKITLFLAQVPVMGSVVAEQLSWPGPAYAHLSLTLPLLSMQFLSILFFLRVKISDITKPAIVVTLTVVASFSIIAPQTTRSDGVDKGITQLKAPESFFNWYVSPSTANAITELQAAASQCPGDQLFQLAWMPISYELTGRNNVTKFDLPYHDTITVDAANNIMSTLVSNPPGMLTIQWEYSDYSGPFPALGMKLLYEQMPQLLQKYHHQGEVSDNYNSFSVYCLRTL